MHTENTSRIHANFPFNFSYYRHLPVFEPLKRNILLAKNFIYLFHKKSQHEFYNKIFLIAYINTLGFYLNGLFFLYPSKIENVWVQIY